MRLAKLELLAYGHFRGLTLDFSSPGIHVVIGRNEAGKSTTLRAITGLFYGIDRYTADAFLHPMKDLRIGGVIEGSNGERVRVVRRKGAINTLLDAQGQPLDETVMKRLLNGVTEETFRNAFGLDHDRLEAGARGLLDGGGDLGESLFDASVGGGGGEVQRLLADLANEADKIYRPRGTALPLNDALKSFADAQKTVREKQSLPEAFLTQERGLEEITNDRAMKLERKAELIAKKDRLARGRKRIPLERKRERALERRAAFGRLANPDAIVRVDALRERYPGYLHAAELYRTHTRDAERLADRIAEAARRAGIDPNAETTNLQSLRLDAKKEARIHALLGERSKLMDRVERSQSEISRLEREQSRLREEIVAMTPPAPPKRAPSKASSKQASLFDDNDAPLVTKGKKASPAAAINQPQQQGDDDRGTALHVALDRARSLGDIETRIAAQHGHNERQKKKLETRAAALGLFDGPLSSFVKLRLPAAASIERLEQQATEVGRTLSLLQERGGDLDREAAAIEKQMAAHAGDFAPPDAATLAKARAERDQALATATKLTGEVERLVREVDAIADRMIREADRVTTIARLKSEAETNARQRERLQRDKTKAVAERAAIDAEYHALFAESKIKPLGFAEMAQWIDRHVQIVDAYDLLREAIAALVDEENKVVRAKTELVAALAAIKDAEKAEESAALSELIAIGTRKLAAIDATRQRAEEAARNLQKVRSELEERTFELNRDLTGLSEVKTRLDELLHPIGVASDAPAEEVTRSIEALRDLFALADTRDDTVARARNAQSDVRAFETDLKRAARDLAPDLQDEEIHGDLGPALFSRGAEAAKNAQELAHFEEQLEAEGTVSFVSDEERLLASDQDAALRAEEALTEEIEDIEREVSHLTERIGAGRLGLEQMRAESNAAEAAADAQRALARVKDQVNRWCRAKLASVLLAREIERYREENQAPLLLATSNFFSRLTLESFTGVKAGFDDKDKPCLRCVRADGGEVDIEGLSDGTRDQLYLSLRLSSLLRRAEVAEPMPLILDDVLIQLDDQRASAALSVLSEVSQKMQILFFTHHARLVDLARATIKPGALVVHELEGHSGEITASP